MWFGVENDNLMWNFPHNILVKELNLNTELQNNVIFRLNFLRCFPA